MSAGRIGAPPVAAVLPDGRRHFQHGPIDLVLEAFGARSEVQPAYHQAWDRFRTVLDELVAELPALRTPLGEGRVSVSGPVAREMVRACAPHLPLFITPMAAVAGAVADEVLGALTRNRRLDKAYVNNGGDIALYLAPGQSLTVGLVTLGKTPSLEGFSRIEAASPVRGIATSGWRGRSFSMGIADSVTVLASTGAVADAAATLIANAVNVDDPAILREPAADLAPDSDLGERLVTVEVGSLRPDKIERASFCGVACARRMRRRGLILDALLVLQGHTRTLDRAPAEPVAPA